MPRSAHVQIKSNDRSAHTAKPLCRFDLYMFWVVFKSFESISHRFCVLALVLSKNIALVLESKQACSHRPRTRVETKIFLFVFSRKFRENLFSLFAKKVYEKLRK
jgi:hypothetical protein